jgi:hypothetical protein
MRKFVLLATVALLAVALLASGVGTAAAEPQKNQILVPVKCDNGQSYTLVINGMSKVGQISGGNQNLVVTEFDVTFRDPDTGDVVGTDTFDRGKAEESNGNNPQDDPIRCTGSIRTTLQGIGLVDAEFVFEGFVTPRGE